MTTAVITQTRQTTKIALSLNMAQLAIWQQAKGILKKSKPDPVQYQRQARKERLV